MRLRPSMFRLGAMLWAGPRKNGFPSTFRRYQDIWPDQHGLEDQYAVINDEGYTIGTIQRPAKTPTTTC